MKIINFIPKTGTAAGITNQKNLNKSGDFGKILNMEICGSSPVGDPGKTVSMENMRASQVPPTSDMGRAGLLLDRLGGDIRSASSQRLSAIHNMETLVYVYRKTN